MRKLILSGKFYLGASLVFLSFIIGAITHFAIIIYFNQPLYRWISIVAYVISWPMLIIGAYMAGKEYVESIKKFFSYRYYGRKVKKGTKKVYHAAKHNTKRLENHARVKTAELRKKTKERTRRIREKTEKRANNIKNKAKRIMC